MSRSALCRARGVGVIVGVALLSACSSWVPNPENKASLDAHGLWLVYDTGDLTAPSWEQKPRLTMTENGTDVPVDVYPARWVLTFKRRFPLPVRESTLAVVPCVDSTVADFAKAYPNLSAQVDKLARLLEQRPTLPRERRDLPDDWVVDQEHAIASRVQFVDFQSGAGILYLTQYTQEEQGDPVNNEQLVCVFQGLSKDRRSYLSAHLAIGHPGLPAGTAAAQSLVRDPQGKYLRAAEATLEGAADEAFQPSLAHIKSFIASLALRPERGASR